jgi:GTP-binding protein Era
MQGHDIVLCLFKANSWDREDETIVQWLEEVEVPKIAVITHIDTVDGPTLDKTLEKIRTLGFQGISPISAKKNIFMDILYANIICLLQELKPDNAAHNIDHSEGFLAQEMIREQIMNLVHKEIPYAVNIEILQLKHTEEKIIIHANLIVAKANHKKKNRIEYK